jgi:hypothetical protein
MVPPIKVMGYPVSHVSVFSAACTKSFSPVELNIADIDMPIAHKTIN